MLESAINFVPTFVLVVFRLAGMALYAPLFGSARIPRQIRVMLILVLAFGVTPGVPAHRRFRKPRGEWRWASAVKWPSGWRWEWC